MGGASSNHRHQEGNHHDGDGTARLELVNTTLTSPGDNPGTSGGGEGRRQAWRPMPLPASNDLVVQGARFYTGKGASQSYEKAFQAFNKAAGKTIDGKYWLAGNSYITPAFERSQLVIV
jgi:hypothetical protein